MTVHRDGHPTDRKQSQPRRQHHDVLGNPAGGQSDPGRGERRHSVGDDVGTTVSQRGTGRRWPPGRAADPTVRKSGSGSGRRVVGGRDLACSSRMNRRTAAGRRRLSWNDSCWKNTFLARTTDTPDGPGSGAGLIRDGVGGGLGQDVGRRPLQHGDVCRGLGQAGTIVTAVAPEPSTTTRRPAKSRSVGHCCGWTISPPKVSSPGRSGVYPGRSRSRCSRRRTRPSWRWCPPCRKWRIVTVHRRSAPDQSRPTTRRW